MPVIVTDGEAVHTTSVASLGSVAVTSSSGTLTSGQTFNAKRPATGTPKMGIVYLHGGFSTPAEITDGSSADLATTALAAAGFPVIAPSVGGSLWGSDTARAYIDEAWRYLIDTLGADPYHRVGFIGTSMGAANAFSWISAGNLTNTACLVGLAPLCDTGSVYGIPGDPFTITASIDAAYGSAAGWAAAQATHDPKPIAEAGKLARLRFRAWYGSADTTVTPSTVTYLAGLVGPSAALQLCPNATHATLLPCVEPAEVVRFVAKSYEPVATQLPVVT